MFVRPRPTWNRFVVQIGLFVTGIIILSVIAALLIGGLSDGRNQLAILLGDKGQGRFRIYLTDTNRAITSVVYNDNHLTNAGPVWSADGNQIAFEQMRDQSNEIYAVNVFDGTTQRITNHHVTLESDFSWSPDNKQISFIAQHQHGVFVADVQGDASVALAEFPDSSLSSPVWSPDSRQLAFVTTTNPGHSSLYIVDRNGLNLRQLVEDFPTQDKLFLSWSPDGSQIAFDPRLTGGGDIYTVSTDNGDMRQLTQSEFREAGPAWSPDSSRLAFWETDNNGTINIYTVNADGSGLARSASLGIALCAGIGWSSDGTRVSVLTFRPSTSNARVYLMNPDGSDLNLWFDSDYYSPNLPAWRP